MVQRYFQSAQEPSLAFPMPAGVPPEQTSATHHLLIDARDCERPAPFQLVARLPQDYLNVSRVELRALCMPRVEGEAWVALHIDELSGLVDSTDTAGAHSSFAVVFFDAGATPGQVAPMKAGDYYTRQATFTPPLGRLGRLTVHLKKHGGDPVILTDTAGVDTFSMLLEVTTASRH